MTEAKRWIPRVLVRGAAGGRRADGSPTVLGTGQGEAERVAPGLREQAGRMGVSLHSRASRKKMSLVVHPWPRFLPLMAQIHLYLLNDTCVSSLGLSRASTHSHLLCLGTFRTFPRLPAAGAGATHCSLPCPPAGAPSI